MQETTQATQTTPTMAPPQESNGSAATAPTPSAASITPAAPSPIGSMTPKASPPAAATPDLNAPQVAEWMKDLPDDIKSEKMFGNFKSVEDLARSFVSAQRMVGRDKISIPDPKVATEADYQAVFKKLGLPEDVKDFKMEISPDAGIDPGFQAQISEQAHKLGILPKQLEKLLGWYGGEAKSVVQAHQAKLQAEHQDAHRALGQKWGKAFDQNILAAQLALKDGASPEQIKYLESKGLTTDTVLVEIFATLGNKFKEGELKGGTQAHSNFLAPQAAKAEADRIMGDTSHPIHNKQHPNHALAVKQHTELMAQAFPEEPKE